MTKTTKEEKADFKRDMLATLPSLRAFAISLCGNRSNADDLVQEAILRAWAKQESFKPGTNIKAWLFTILRNEFYSRMRKKGREVQDSEGLFTQQMAVAPAQLGALDFEDFKAALAKLPEDQREAIILIGASGFSYEEAAEMCGCAVGTIKSRVSRARTHLQELLDVSGSSDYGPDELTSPTVSKSFHG